MVNINRICDEQLDWKYGKGVKMYYCNLTAEKLWSKILLHFDRITIAKKIYYIGNPFKKCERLLKKEFFEDGSLKSIYLYCDEKIKSKINNFPAITEYDYTGNYISKLYNENIENEPVLEYIDKLNEL